MQRSPYVAGDLRWPAVVVPQRAVVGHFKVYRQVFARTDASCRLADNREPARDMAWRSGHARNGIVAWAIVSLRDHDAKHSILSIFF